MLKKSYIYSMKNINSLDFVNMNVAVQILKSNRQVVKRRLFQKMKGHMENLENGKHILYFDENEIEIMIDCLNIHLNNQKEYLDLLSENEQDKQYYNEKIKELESTINKLKESLK